MPIDMQRPKKIPLGGDTGPGDLKRIEIEPAEDGSFIVTCYTASDGGGPMGLSVAEGKRYTFQSADQMANFVNQKARGDAAAERVPSTPVDSQEGEPPPTEPEPDTGADAGAAAGAEPPPPDTGGAGAPSPADMVAPPAARQVGRVAGRAAGRTMARNAPPPGAEG